MHNRTTRVLRALLVGVIAAQAVACATAPDKVSASYVSPLQYQGYDCDQIRQEMLRVSAKVREVSGAQAKSAKNDAIAVGVGVVLFWPALFFLASGDQKEELARLKGEYDALNQAAIQKKCSVADEVAAAKTS
jgi:hypothetical protein